jgi:hypothetical protein
MSSKGSFKDSVLSIELQLKALFEEVGGEAALNFLNCLGRLNRSEQERILKVFQSVTERVERGNLRLETAEDRTRKEFEDALYEDIVRSFGSNALKPEPLSRRRLTVVEKEPPASDQSAPISLDKVRAQRRERTKTIH